MTWRRGRPVDAIPAPRETALYTGKTEVGPSGAVPLVDLSIETVSIGFTSDIDNSGTIYFGDADVDVDTGFPMIRGLYTTIDTNQNKNPIYVIGEIEGDIVNWVAII